MQRGVEEARCTPDQLATTTVLHVDDDPVFLDLTRGILEQRGVDVTSESDPLAVADRLDGRAIDAVVSDYEMPDMDGVDLFERVKAAYPKLPFVLFTGKDRDEVSMDLSRDGAWYVQKRGTRAFDRLATVVAEAVEAEHPVAQSDR